MKIIKDDNKVNKEFLSHSVIMKVMNQRAEAAERDIEAGKVRKYLIVNF